MTGLGLAELGFSVWTDLRVGLGRRLGPRVLV